MLEAVAKWLIELVLEAVVKWLIELVLEAAANIIVLEAVFNNDSARGSV